MDYTIAQKPNFWERVATLGGNMSSRVVNAVTRLLNDPINISNKNLEKLKHHERLWTYRVNDNFRLLYAVFDDVVLLLDVGTHDYIYRVAEITQADPERALAVEDVLDPRTATTPAQVPDWEHNKRRKAEDAFYDDREGLLPQVITAEKLDGLNIPSVYHDDLIACETQEDLANLLGQGLPEDIFDKLDAWLFQPSLFDLAEQPTYVLKNPEDLQRYADGDLMGFLLWLDDEQQPLVNFALKGPTLVKGGPGSGKSTVALYRVKALMDQDQSYLEDMTPRVLFTTYTNALVNASKQLLEQLLDQPDWVDVHTLDKVARRVVVSVEGNGLQMASSRHWREALSGARTHVAMQARGSLADRILQEQTRFPDSYLIDEMQWVIEGQALDTLEDYLAVQRFGRTYALSRSQREAIWEIYQYVQQYFESNHLTSWNTLRRRAIRYIETGQYADLYDYVLVDEAQDLTPVGLRLAVMLCRQPSGLFLTADMSQSLYNRGFSWNQVHDDLRVAGRTRILKRNYRTTRQIAEASNRFLGQGKAGDEETLAQYYVHSGPQPVVFAGPDFASQLDWLYEQIHATCRDLRMGWEAIGILTPSNDLAQHIAMSLPVRYQLPAYYVENGNDLDLQSPVIKVMTIHSAKGLEFPVVALPCLEQGVLPRNLDPDAEDYMEKLGQAQRLFYVGATRAMRRLLVTFQQDNPSEFIGQLAPDYWEFVNG